MSLREYDWQIVYGSSDEPLHSFYIPALQRSVQYDRSAGFFSSSALAIAAAGVAGLIQNNGRMRLLVGAQLDDRDVQAIINGQEALEGIVAHKLLDVLQKPVEDVMRQRWEVLAWMIAHGTLEIKVVLPIDARGVPIPEAREYFHIKEGIFTDANGDQISFNGSINESETAWQHNYEQFSVYRSWEASRAYLMQSVYRFDRLWNGQERSWLALDIPQAARNALIRFAPDNPPEHDPLDRRVTLTQQIAQDVEAALRKERILFQFLRDAPYMPDSRHLGAATSAIKPWPHQLRVADRIVTNYPNSYMLCDEVGLGKTIEAGLVLRQLVISGMVKRCLLLVPRSVARQWQEELYEKFVLDIPLFDGKQFRNHGGEVLIPQHTDDNLWNQFDIFIATSQLAKRQERQLQLRQARPWDLIMVDEAHHARRKDFLNEDYYRPNRLLDLLTDPKIRKQSILLMTATPMQVHPLEVWDLLKVLGMGGKWGASDRNFIEFFTELRQTDDANIAWDFVFSMVCDYLDTGGKIDPRFEQESRKALGPVNWKKISGLPCSPDVSSTVKRLPVSVMPYVREMARQHTPLRRYMFRNTRDLLREYVTRGLLNATVPTRSPEPVWIRMREDERELYDRIEEYISQFYRKYEEKRTGRGFVMTVYRRRLTSSFYAVRKSLERRLDLLSGRLQNGSWATDEDLEQEDLAADVTEDLNGAEGEYYQEEIDYVHDFLNHLDHLSQHDSKTEQLLGDLSRVFLTHNTVLVFTQYTDTMDYLRAKLLDVYDHQVACYSGRGGELWNGIGWVEVPKEEIKQKFRRGDEIKILLCTEAASEGLNLQTCGMLINYDMPWNPMRVEQRIGRIDRIGQIHDTVYIRNYFYQDTIEARVYQALSSRIDWFENVVGNLQPILARISRVIEDLVMTTRDERESRFQQVIADLEESIAEQAEYDVLEVYEGTETVQEEVVVDPPVTLTEVEQFLVQSRLVGQAFSVHAAIDAAYVLSLPGHESVSVTFDPPLFDAHPNSLQMLSYGSELFQDLLSVDQPITASDSKGILRLSVEHPIPLVGFYILDKAGKPKRLRYFRELAAAVSDLSFTWSDNRIAEAMREFETIAEQQRHRRDDLIGYARSATELSIAERARVVLTDVALIELASHQIDGTVSNGNELNLSNEILTKALAHHDGAARYLLHFLHNRIEPSREAVARFGQLLEMNKDQLKRQFRSVHAAAENLASELKLVQKGRSISTAKDVLMVSAILC